MAQNNKSTSGKVLHKIKKGIYRILLYFHNMDRLKRVLLQVGIVTLIIGLVAGGFAGKAIADKSAAKKTKEAVAKTKASVEKKSEETSAPKETKDVPWNLVLVNESHPMDSGYSPELVETESYSVDKRIADATKEMLDAAASEGMSMVVCSSYRSVEKQTQVFNSTVVENLAGGENYWAAYGTTKQSVALPGTSEHGMGLAMDIVSSEYGELDDKQADTKEAKWLEANCYKYGFILRYPKDKTDETGIIFEPWHYRYVGKEDAKKIMQSGVTLETYLKENYNVE